MKVLLAASMALSMLVTDVVAAEHEIISGCEIKKQQLTGQLEQAELQQNSRRIAGLQRALAAVNNNCTDEVLIQEARQAVAEYEQEVAERQHELAKAREEGKEQKIEKQARKLQEAQEKLDLQRFTLKELERNYSAKTRSANIPQ
jgi:hypothetical protein